MKSRKVYDTIIEAMELPQIIRLKDKLFGAQFFLMKLLPARFILDRARAEGMIRPGSVIIETSSGTFGLALAMMCRLEGYQLILVSDPAIEPPLQKRLEDLGARVEILKEPVQAGGYQKARLDRVVQLLSQYHDAYWPAQYHNEHNPAAYAPVAELLAETIGQIDYLVGTVGSGGSMCGTSKYLRLLFSTTKSVAIDTHGSILFGQPDQKKRTLRGLGNSLMPKNLDHTVFDAVHWVNASEAYAATRDLHQQHALFMGPTSGAAYLVAHWLARENAGANVVALLPDEGHRYQDSVYNDQWLHDNHSWLGSMPVAPRLVEHPLSAGPDWCWMNWNCRAYEKVMDEFVPH